MNTAEEPPWKWLLGALLGQSQDVFRSCISSRVSSSCLRSSKPTLWEEKGAAGGGRAPRGPLYLRSAPGPRWTPPDPGRGGSGLAVLTCKVAVSRPPAPTLSCWGDMTHQGNNARNHHDSSHLLSTWLWALGSPSHGLYLSSVPDCMGRHPHYPIPQTGTLRPGEAEEATATRQLCCGAMTGAAGAQLCGTSLSIPAPQPPGG